LAYSRLGGAENIGYIIPCEEIDLFLKDLADGHYDGKPAMFDEFQTLENPALRAFLKLDKSVEGIAVHEAFEDKPDYPLKMWDVVTKIGDVQIDNEGMVKVGNRLRVRFRYLVQTLAKDDHVPLKIIRAGKELSVSLPVSPTRPMLIKDLHNEYPPYFVYGPIVFTPATSLFTSALNGNANMAGALSAVGSPLVTRRGDKPAFEGEELVVVSSPLFPHKLSKGYSTPFSRVVKTVNGIAIKNLKHLVEVLRDTKEEFIVLEFNSHGGESLVFPRKDTLAAVDAILTDNDIRQQGSTELMEVWNQKPAAAAGKP